MFQYAAGLTVARRLGTDFMLDLTPFEGGYKLHRYGLNHLNISAPAASREEIGRLKNRRLKSLPKFMRPALEKKRTHYRNLSLAFDPRVVQLQAPIYLEGYFQSERYFKEIEGDIRREFSFRTEASDENVRMLEHIRNTPNATAIHVRRGDYVTDTVTHELHGTCSADYYRTAIAKLQEQVREVQAFVFSDEADWAEENLKLEVPTCVVRHNPPERGYEDLRLMAACRHFIIANSSFSWWGAWLSSSPGKTVYAPEKWMRDPALNSPDIYPREWIKVNA